MSKVFGWLADHGGRGYYRVQLPMQALKDRGVDARSGRVLGPDWREYDVIVGQQVCKPGPSQLWEKICRDPNVKAVFEIDDDLWNLHGGHQGGEAQGFWSREALDQLTRNIKMADEVTVTTKNLADEIYIRTGRACRVVPNFIDEEVLKTPASVMRQRPESLFGKTVIGYQAAQYHGEDFKEAWEPIKRTLRQTSAHYMSMGEDYPAALGIPSTLRDRFLYSPWIVSDWDRYYRAVALFDIGIAPLRDNRFNQSKSWIKVLEYAALGIPSVASTSFAYIEAIEHGQRGFLADSEDKWFRHLRVLVNDPFMRQAMGDAAWRWASQMTIQANVGQWADALGVTLPEKVSLS